MDGIDGFRRSVSNLSLFLYSFAALFLQLGLIPYFSSIIGVESLIWAYLYKGFWLFCLAIAIANLAVMPQLLSRTWPVLICVFVSSLLVGLTSLNDLSKNLVMSGITVGVFVVLISAAGTDRCLRFCAQLVAVSAIYVLLDIQFLDGISNTAGRAAGLYVNPNIAAGVLLVAAIPSSIAVSDKYKISFWILIAAAICTTLSRTTVSSLFVVLLVYGSSLAYLKRFSEIVIAVKSGVTNIVVTGLVVSSLIISAAVMNPRFGLALQTADLKINSIAVSDNDEEYVAGSEPSGSVLDNDGFTENETTASHRKTINSENARIKNAEKRSSADTRILLFKRTFAAFLESPLTGIGLKNSYQLRPHNTYLLFAVAYGTIGLIIPLALVAHFLLIRTPAAIAIGVGLGLLMFFSHDVLLMPVYVLPITLALAGSLKKHEGLSNVRNNWTQLPSQLALIFGVTFVLWMNFSIASSSPKFINEALDPDSISEINSCAYYFEPLLPSIDRFYTLDVSQMETHSKSHRIELLENGLRLKWNPLQTKLTSQRCDGQYAITTFGGVVFSASDGSNPIENKRTYEANYPVTVHPLIPILAVLMVVWLFIEELQRRKERKSPSERVHHRLANNQL